ncbi:MAG: DinB family protein [Candidatus Brocadia sp.]
MQKKDKARWEEEVPFFDVKRSRAWVMTRRIANTAHHRGQLSIMLRMLGREIYSTYGPSAVTGGLMQNSALTIYPYPDVDTLLKEEAAGGDKAPLPGPGDKPCTERPDPG